MLDFFAGSGTTGEAAASNGRKFVLIDDNPEAVEVMRKRLSEFGPTIEDDSNREILADDEALTS